MPYSRPGFESGLQLLLCICLKKLKSRNPDRILPSACLHAVQLTPWRDPNSCTEAESTNGAHVSVSLSHCGYHFHTMKARN